MSEPKEGKPAEGQGPERQGSERYRSERQGLAAQVAPQPADFAKDVSTAVVRGLRGQCPHCGAAGLFRAFLKPIDHCPACGQDWSPQRADDFPAYVAIFVTGHVIAPIIILLVQKTALPLWVLITLVLGMALAIMLASLQPAKGAIIALQWWFGMHGFEPGRPDEA